ncbi:rab3 GTPase-activating protein catalytic subunit isoform X2 [Cotesia glomerata]|uniref:rab3 GTPase-activating protein catalytic subunit isoform X2 n=1 Tax=Cotesia glomerata TaxID=32391 RepID=UPI001D032204|nr:rab3 GTPase-activating protein catalytic subunit isoform X2 [Cotesia glomerata]
MHNVEIEDFYHHDFTTASEWEVFIARLEEIIHEWKLPHSKLEPALKSGDFVNLTWEVKSEELNFANYPFLFKHFKLKTSDSTDKIDSETSDEDSSTQSHIDVLNIANDFARVDQDYLEIARYYGIREFVLLTPAKKISISDETRIKILVSSLTIASTNSNSEVPALVQVQEPWQKYYLGVSVGKGTITHLDMVHLKKTPPHCRHLTGLLALFKQKIGEGSGVRLDPVMVSIRFTYLLKDWLTEPHFDFMKGKPVTNNELGKLPFGAEVDPVSELQVYATWPQMSENIVVDSESFTDLEPQLATEWSARVKMVATPPSLLEEHLKGFLNLCNNQKLLVDILGDAYVDNDQMLSSAFNIVTESKIPTISKVMSRASSKKSNKNDGPIPDDTLMLILYYLFPDADEQSKAMYDEIGSNIDEDLWKGIKTCALDSLVWRLAIVTAHCRQNLGGIQAVAQIWHEFVQEMRYRWDESILIPGVGTGFPDSVRTCLLHQKLQMINCCIERKKRRNEFDLKPLNIVDHFDSEEESEEEFFECEEEASVQEVQVHRKTKHLLWNKPTGRLSKHPSLKLLKTGDALYLPVTQDPVPKTEDQLEEDAQLMMQLGTDKQGSEMRARLMSASLLSDMESFKAANPGSELEDFIRWYSPRDWIEEEGTDQWGQINGHLSPRMKIPNNPWATTWNSAQPVPAHRQKRLFDDTKEAEKTIQFLACRRIGEICQLLMPVLAHAALQALAQHKQQAIAKLPDIINGITTKLQRATKSFHLQTHIYDDIIDEISTIKALLTQYNSLNNKFPGENEETTAFIINLMEGKEVSISGGARSLPGLRITEMFRNSQKATYMVDIPSSGSGRTGAGNEKQKTFPEPSSKEFILRGVTPRPSPTSAPQPQRLYVNLKRESIRLAGFFSEDTTFL